MAKDKDGGADKPPENPSAGLPLGGSPPAPDNAPRPETIPGGRYMVDGRLVDAEGRPLDGPKDAKEPAPE